MSNALRKIRRQNPLNIKMGMKFECPICKNTKIIPRESFNKMTEEEFQEGKIFTCNKCKIKMNPKTIEVDF